jgi:hypothetical protein
VAPHALPHWPQLRWLVCVSTQLPPPQSVCPAAQPLHAPLLHVWPLVQSVAVRHSTQRLAVVSQYFRPFVPVQFASAVHWTQVNVVLLHAGRRGSPAQFGSSRHSTQMLPAVSQ